MKKIASLKFCYKGDRNYVHGTDIYNKVSKIILNNLKIADIKNIDFSIHKIITNNLNFEIYKFADFNSPQNAAAVFYFNNHFDKYKVLLSENREKVKCRYKYSEEMIVSRCVANVDKKAISLESMTKYTDVEVFTAMNKALLENVYSYINAKWLLSKLQIKEYVYKSDYNVITVELKHNFNFRLTKSSIRIDGDEIGSIYFSSI